MTRKIRIQQRTGIEALNAIDEKSVLKLMEDGVLVQLHISYWRPYSRLSEADLGIKTDSEIKKYLQFGRKKLLPPYVILQVERVEANARRNLEDHSFPCLWGRFIPITAWDEWHEENERIKAQFHVVMESVINEMPNIAVELDQIYRKMAEDAQTRLHFIEKELPDNFVDQFVQLCKAQIPTQDAMRAACKYSEVYNYIPLPEQLNINVQAEGMKSQVADELNKQKQEIMTGFFADINLALRQMVASVCQNVKTSIEKNDRLVSRSVVGLKNLITKVEVMNFHNDPDVAGMINDIKKELDNKDSLNMFVTLNNVQETANEQIAKFTAMKESRYSAIEV